MVKAASRRKPSSRDETEGGMAWPQDDPDGRRRYRRLSISFPAVLLSDDQACACTVEDVSPGGACVRPGGRFPVTESDEIVLEIEAFGCLPAEVVHMTDGVIGLMFLYENDERLRFTNWLVGLLKGEV